MATVSSACALLPLEGRAGVVPLAQDGNATFSNCGVECVMPPTKGSGRQMASLRMKLRLSACPTTRSVHKQPLNFGAVLDTESWLGSEESVSNAEEAIVEENVEFPSEFDLLRLERARLSDMEHSFRAGYDAESALLEAEQGYVEQLELLLGRVSSLVREAEGTTSTTKVEVDADSMNAGIAADGLRHVDITVRSSRKGERARRRERALVKAEKAATALAAAPAAPKPKKLQISQDPSNPVRAYLRDIGKSKLLTALEEVALSRKIQDLLKLERVKADLKREVGREPTISEWCRAVGMKQNAFEMRVEEGRLSKEMMVKSNLRLVVSIAKNYQGRDMTFQDLIQAITRSIADQSRTIRLPIYVYEVISRINKAKRALVMEHGRKPLDEEVSELVGLSVEKLQTIVKATRAPTSMERTIGEEGTTMVGELVADQGVESPEDGIMKQLLKQDVERMLRTLSPREGDVLRLRFGLDDGQSRTLEEIGRIFKVTRERIRQIEAEAMRKMRQSSILLEHLDVKGI